MPELRLLPVPRTAVFRDERYYIWCGSMLRTDDGKCHLFYSRWPRKLGHYAWVTHSEVAHAVADSPLGPYRHHEVALPARGKALWDGLCTHNPTIHKFGNQYYLYYMGNTGDGVAMKTLNWPHRNNQRIGVAVADSPWGPWKRFDKPLIDTTPGFHDALMTSNPAVCATPEGKILMVYKGVGTQKPAPFGGPVVHIAALGETPTGPFVKHPKPVFTKEGVLFAAEDPYIWCDGKRFWAIVKDNEGHFTHAGKSLALFTSADGLDWKPTESPLVATTELTWADGTKQKLNSLERPQLWRSADGKEAVLFCACDETPERTHSFSVAIPVALTPSQERWTGEGYRLAWSDEFTGTMLDRKKWVFRTDSKHWSTQKPENVRVADGFLHLELKKEEAGDKHYTGAGVISQKTFLYGYYEARFKTPPGAGWHSSFWLMTHDGSGGTGTKATYQELDVIENDSINPLGYGVNTHKWNPQPHQSFGGKHVKTPDLSADFHTFGCEFTPTSVKYYFDGTLVQTVDATKFSHSPQHIWLTSIASSLGKTTAVDESKLPATVLFDYVRYYEKKP